MEILGKLADAMAKLQKSILTNFGEAAEQEEILPPEPTGKLTSPMDESVHDDTLSDNNDAQEPIE